MTRVVSIPAPDLAGLAFKIGIVAHAELAELAYARPALAALAEDASRLAALRADCNVGHQYTRLSRLYP